MAIWRARKATVSIDSAIASVSDASELNGQQSGSEVDYSGQVRNLDISGSESEVESVYFFGETAAGSQNAEVEEKTMSMRELSMTLAYKDQEPAALAVSAASAIGTTGFSRVQGDTTRTVKSVMITLYDGTNTVNILLNNAYMTKLGDITLDSEGFAEQTIMFKCLAKDYYEESDFA